MSMIPLRKTFGVFGLCWLLAPLGQAGEPVLTPKDLPRLPLVPPTEATGTVRLKNGFHLELAAAEPLVASPVAMAFDERGRLFVVEMVDYSERRDQSPHLGRIRLLEDTKGNGVFDKSSVYVENLAWPTAVFCWGGGVFVVATPDIIYLKDTHGDGRADHRETVFTGFAAGVERLNVQELANSLVWGLDNRIHGATSGEGGMVKSLRHPEISPINLRGRDFVIDPRTMTLRAEAGGGQHGLSFDDYGRRFTCNNSDHLRFFQYEDRYAARNPFSALPAPLASIAVDGPAAEVYRISPDEAWRVLRTHWRVASLVPGPVEGGGRASGYFTGATGVTIYRGDAFPAAYRGNAFVGECAGNLVSRKVLFPADVGLEARRSPDEQKVEFLASTDNWFRPVQMANAPDGTLYVIDMHREIVEHPWSLPEGMKKLLDLDSGDRCGRIFRIVPDGFQRRPPPRLDQASSAELVATLAHPNGWHRDTAARLLAERQDRAAIPALTRLLESGPAELGRLHALYALAGLRALTPAHVLQGLGDPAPWVRVHALRLAETFARDPSSALLTRLGEMVSDPDLQVRYQLAFTLGEFSGPARLPSLLALARRDVTSPGMQAALLSSLSQGAGELFATLSRDDAFAASGSGREFLGQLVALLGARHEAAEVATVLEFLAPDREPAVAFGLVRALGEGAKRGKTTLTALDPAGKLQTVYAQAAITVAQATAPLPLRLEAAGLLGSTTFPVAGPALASLLSRENPEALQLAAIVNLARFSEPRAGRELTNHWADFAPRARSQAVAALLARPDRATLLLEALQDRRIAPTELTTAQTRFLRNHADAAVRRRAEQVLGIASAHPLQKAVAAYQPALELKGEAGAGRRIFVARCSSCHHLGGVGFTVGPDLLSTRSNGKDKLLISILDPSREIAPPYIVFTIETREGDSYVGIISGETTTSVTVRQAYGKEDVLLRANLKGMQSQGQSLMPEGLEAGLSPQDVADLLEFVTTAKRDE